MSSNSLLFPRVSLLAEQMNQLPKHVAQCRAARGAWFEAALVAEAMHKLLAPRFVTTVVLAGIGLVIVNALG